MSSSELFQHAILDKFYSSFLKTGKICFQPTVYSDKTNFLNYMANLSMFSDNIMDLMSDKSQEFVDLYKNTFFSAHNQIQANVVIKMEKLMSFTAQKSPKNLETFSTSIIFIPLNLNQFTGISGRFFSRNSHK